MLADRASEIHGACPVPRATAVAFATSQVPIAPRIKPALLTPLRVGEKLGGYRAFKKWPSAIPGIWGHIAAKKSVFNNRMPLTRGAYARTL